MTEETKQGGKGGGKAASQPPIPAPAEQKQEKAPTEARYSGAEHIALAKQAYGENAPLVAAGIAHLDAGSPEGFTDGYTKAEIEAAIAEVKTTEIKEG